MFNNQHRLKVAAVLCAALFVIGLARLFWLRFERGDLYPPYSSLRSDPLGVQVLFESLDTLGENGVKRNFRPFSRFHMAPDTVFFVCGLGIYSPEWNGRKWTSLFETIAASGGRVVVTFTSTIEDNKEEDDDNSPHDPYPPKEDENTSSTDEGCLKDEDDAESGWWGLGFSPLLRNFGGVFPDDSAARVLQEDLPETLLWRSPVFFELYNSAWKTVYRFMDEPVVIKRSWGEGEIVMVAGSYLFSNEALRSHRVPAFLAWVLPPDRPLVFDEFHHGLSKQPGIAGLARKYRLHGVVLSLLLLVILMLWRQASVFVPVSGDAGTAAEEVDLGRDSAEGWVSLTQQHIAARDLLNVCHEAWRSSAATKRIPEERLKQVQDLVDQYIAAPRRFDVVVVYRSISELLKQGRIT